jgi:mannan endo-1,4-beta-mannosidase
MWHSVLFHVSYDLTLACSRGSHENLRLTASYFTNRWLHGAAVLSRVDASINFVWPSFITDSGKDFVSVRWVGYVLPAFSETYTFFMQVNDGVKVWLDGVVIIDKFDLVVDDAATAVVAAGGFVEVSGTSATPLVAGVPYDLKVEYRENEGLAVSAARCIISRTHHL